MTIDMHEYMSNISFLRIISFNSPIVKIISKVDRPKSYHNNTVQYMQYSTVACNIKYYQSIQ